MKEILKNLVIEDLFDIRTDGFQCLYKEKFDNRKNIENKKVELIDRLKEIIEDEEEIRNIVEKYEEYLYEEMNYWNLAYYKIGFMDGMSMSEEIKDLKNIMTG